VRISKKKLKASIVNVDNVKDLDAGIKDKKIGFAPLCGGGECEDLLKENCRNMASPPFGT